MFAEWMKTGKPTLLGAISGAVAGLVVITPASGFVGPMSALAMGAIGGVVCFIAATSLKHVLGYDDSLDAFGVHGIGGTIGAILTGVFAQKFFNPAIADVNNGILFGGKQLTNQLIATAITWVLAAIGCFILLKITDVVCGLRVAESDEFDGLDLSQHGERGYNFDEEFGGTVMDGGAASASPAVAREATCSSAAAGEPPRG